MNATAKKRMYELVDILNKASRSYHLGCSEESLLSDKKYDSFFKELVNLESQLKQVLPNSPTTRVGSEEKEGDSFIKHYEPILSLKDTKSVDEMLYFLGEQEGVLSWKLDGISIVLYYANGRLERAASRGDGLVGKDITKNVKLMRNVPLTIPHKSHIVVRGEGVLSLNEFEQIKATKEGERFSNPRNLAAGLINSTKTTSTLLRHLSFVAHSVSLVEGKPKRLKLYSDQLRYLESMRFKVVPYRPVLNFELKLDIEQFTKDISKFEYPVDGLVLRMNDLAHGESLGATARYNKHSLAFKWPDEVKLTKVTGVDWSVSKTGLITPIVIFEPIQLEGTTVRRANLHTLKIFEGLKIGTGDIIEVYKANKIIPEVEENMTRSGDGKPISNCPVCNHKTTVVENEKTKKLYCYNCAKK